MNDLSTSPAPAGSQDGAPGAGLRALFIGGAPRSGTTLLGAMLGYGPNQLTVPEAVFKFHLLKDLRDDGLGLAPEAVTARLDADPVFPLWRVPLPEQTTGKVSYPDLIHQLVLAYGQRSGKGRAVHWIDHSPGNIRYATSLQRLFPDARFVNLIRDGRAVAASVMPLDWGPNTISEAAKLWSTHIAQGLALERQSPDGCLTVHYEELLRDPETTLQQVCEFAGLQYDPAMVDSREYDASSHTRTDHGLVGNRPDPGRVDAWKSRLTPRQVETFEFLTGELLDYLGYDMVHGSAALPSPRSERLKDFSGHLLRRAVVDRWRGRGRPGIRTR